MNTTSIDDLFYFYLERAATATDESSSIGIISILQNYNAELGIKIEPRNESDEIYNVDIKLHIKNEQLG